ncbi:MAG: hypothetical protein H0X49_01750 [Acidobacteria bacterium]|nr:hypothetical protein [Acidobacteriota bacterium]
MKRNFVKIIGGTVLAFMVISALTFGSVFAQDESKSESRRGGDRLVGTWDSQVTIRNCHTGAAIRTFASIGTFMSGGTMLDSTSGIPQSLKTPGQGVWSQTGGNTYRFKFKSFSFDANGNFTGWTIINHEANLSHRGDEYESAGTAEVYAPNGNLLFTGCSTTTATRFE